MRVGERFPRFAGGYVVLDDRRPPTLLHAVGSRVYTTRRGGEAALVIAGALRGGKADDAAHLHAVPVDGPCGPAFGDADHVDATGVEVGANGFLSFAAGAR